MKKKEVWLDLFDSAGDANGAVALFEFVNAAGRIHKFLLSGEEGVAGGADAQLDVLSCGACLVSSAASAHD